MSDGTFTSPLNLRQYLRRRDDRVDPVPFLDVMLIGLFFSMFSSSFLLPPGIPIDLPREGSEILVSEPVAAVVTVLPPAPGDEAGEGMVLFGGDMIRQGALELSLREFLRVHPSGRPVLLLKMDSRASLSQLLRISQAARASGFSSVQIAAEEQNDDAGIFQK